MRDFLIYDTQPMRDGPCLHSFFQNPAGRSTKWTNLSTAGEHHIDYALAVTELEVSFYDAASFDGVEHAVPWDAPVEHLRATLRVGDSMNQPVPLAAFSKPAPGRYMLRSERVIRPRIGFVALIEALSKWKGTPIVWVGLRGKEVPL